MIGNSHFPIAGNKLHTLCLTAHVSFAVAHKFIIIFSITFNILRPEFAHLFIAVDAFHHYFLNIVGKRIERQIAFFKFIARNDMGSTEFFRIVYIVTMNIAFFG